ncbi:acyl-CoA dehydrogenase family protein [Enterovirga rhinocerotis]|uniref:Alkylation response protein AidB-like acyl-CoA dehydrogenase n=1 Tax=Enterovirga rhinocerotis TaxID=1339210 RepID=A0A4V3DWL7_9HYPH|nr:acyl-CoA dehydrogenase family protein [Enterovirga rhinocerotis]TDR85299.1 alkylation response protein AidB-like acyl-CoA dehydrogenase [Enterovirga rhinocerotis]
MDQRTPPTISFDAPAAARRIAAQAAARAAALDCDGSFPLEDVRALAGSGLLAALVPSSAGGAGLGEEPRFRKLADVLRRVGYGNLALGRLYEGHVNALQIIARYGTPDQQRSLFGDATDGHLFGVWNTEPKPDGLTFSQSGEGLSLTGRKAFASGAGFVTRALVTARPSAGGAPMMLVVPLDAGTRADLSSWRALGMRASATGTVDFTGLEVEAGAVIGGPDDYHCQPFFSGGAWRFAAVQLGGIEAVFDVWRRHIRIGGRGGDPHQLARLGEGAIAIESGRHWVERAAGIVADDSLPPDRIVAFVNLARVAVERAGLDVLQLSQRSVGLEGFLAGHPLERLSRDLAVYLRQPAPDRALHLAAAEILDGPEEAGELWRP